MVEIIKIEVEAVEPVELHIDLVPAIIIGSKQVGPQGIRGEKGDKGDKGDTGDSGSAFTSGFIYTGIVTDRNINVVAVGYVPTLKEIIRVIPDNEIAEGSAITLSINGGTPVEILNYTSHDEQYSLVLIFLTVYWGVVARQAESYTIKGENTGDETQSTIKGKLGVATTEVDGYATSAQISKLDGIAANAQVNNISDANATSLTGGASNELHSHPLPVHSHAISGVTGLQTALDGKAPLLSRSSTFTIESDFFSTNASAACPGLLGAATSSGAVGVVAGSLNHPGVIYLRDSTTANGNYRFLSDISAFKISGGETAIFVFQARSARATASFRLGFQDSTAIQTQPTDGVWFEGVGNSTNVNFFGRCKNNAEPSATETYVMTLNTWYTGKIEVNADATLVTFTLYAENGTQLWQQTVSTNIPTAVGRETGFGIIAGETSSDAAADILHIDYLRMEINRVLIR